MSGPFVYNPPAYVPSPYLVPYFNQAPPSPFIPPQFAPAPPSTGSSRRVRFEDDDDVPPLTSRPRSWHAPPMQVPSFATPPQTFVPLPQAGYLHPQAAFAPGHHRSRSFGGSTATPPMFTQPWYLCTPTMQPVMQPISPMPVSPMLLPAATPPPPPMQIHPYLNGASPRPDFVFDLSASTFRPMKIRHDGEAVPLAVADFDQPATHPPVYRMRITCDAIPQWPIDLEYSRSPRSVLLEIPSPSGGSMVPITLRDVLLAVYQHLQTQITHLDWARLSYSEEVAISRAYTRRCRAASNRAVMAEQAEASQGVKRIDYLLDRYMFKGLVRAGAAHEGFENVKLMVGPR
ncbi:hypothetical protein PUNSTDRAFT_102896 [Punctularia strigosozonata HHB-11173 SS5]|uniref:uncharacterized protein n=1 Tax=Punctularia strigosozonata (strain HHB-11173) TaxID=741275 RepID=UPI00044178DA|nr:uncharacterized protein PUNSTDRAFT_102896 [Punctularia strigosozonata HHB-11173 SS5]EIN08134.1 hypothetical protein PUNSTDRAFT_102896 [Punctularia strigosozonata HHB-11173 SS5]